jgi:hypothetical protein
MMRSVRCGVSSREKMTNLTDELLSDVEAFSSYTVKLAVAQVDVMS